MKQELKFLAECPLTLHTTKKTNNNKAKTNKTTNEIKPPNLTFHGWKLNKKGNGKFATSFNILVANIQNLSC